MQPLVIAMSFGCQDLPPSQGPASDFLAQAQIALRHGVGVVLLTFGPGGACQKPIQAACRKQVRAGNGATERDQAGIGGVFQQLENDGGDRDVGRFAGGLRLCRRIDSDPAARGDDIAGARPGFDNAAVFQQAIGLQGRGEAGASLAADFAQRRHTRSRAQGAAVHQRRDVACQFLITMNCMRRHGVRP